MNDIKPIRTKDDYDEAIKLLESLIALEPTDGSEESDRIMVLSALIEDYENATFPDHQIDPVKAIRFRMEQLGLRSIDLAPYLGGKSRVSEILSGKRSLTVKMIKNLEEGLGIPASSLVGSAGTNAAKRWTPKIVSLMTRRGYFGAKYTADNPEEVIAGGVLNSFIGSANVLQPALLRQTNYRDSSNIDKQLLGAWLTKVMNEADKIKSNGDVPHYADDADKWVNNLVAFSTSDKGPVEVIEFLKTKGIIVVIEPVLPNTRLDGATMFNGRWAIIGLTLRHDRLDNFWFTLMHEIAHVTLHKDTDEIFFDNLDTSTDLVDHEEHEADEYARNAMIPDAVWSRSPIRRNATPMIIKAFANKLGVSEAVVAGRLRYESGQWHKYTSLVNGATVRQLFGDKVW